MKAKIICIGDRLNDLEQTTNEVAFEYAKEFTLLIVNIDNKLKKIDEHFKSRARKIEKKTFLWRIYNPSTNENLSISKTFMIS